MPFRIYVGDNFHGYDEEDVSDGGSFETYAEALEAASQIVDRSLRWERRQCKDPCDPEELYERYTDFGDSPVIRPEGSPLFSAWEYARSRVSQLCSEPFQGTDATEEG